LLSGWSNFHQSLFGTTLFFSESDGSWRYWEFHLLNVSISDWWSAAEGKLYVLSNIINACSLPYNRCVQGCQPKADLLPWKVSTLFALSFPPITDRLSLYAMPSSTLERKSSPNSGCEISQISSKT
jgi:hypothetical protein